MLKNGVSQCLPVKISRYSYYQLWVCFGETKIQLNFVSVDAHNTDLGFMRTSYFGPIKSPWFYTEMLMDSMDFWIIQTPLPYIIGSRRNGNSGCTCPLAIEWCRCSRLISRTGSGVWQCPLLSVITAASQVWIYGEIEACVFVYLLRVSGTCYHRRSRHYLHCRLTSVHWRWTELFRRSYDSGH